MGSGMSTRCGPMGLLSWLNEVLNPKMIELDHPYFGRLEFITGKNVHNEIYGFWAGELVTPFSERPLGIFIHAGSDGPNDDHRTRYEALIEKFSDLQAGILPILFQEWKTIIREYGDDIDKIERFDTPESMANLFNLADISIEKDAGFELGYLFSDEEMNLPESYIAVDMKWEVTYSGGAD